MSGQYVALTGVSCVDVGNCVAVGSDRASATGGDVYQGLAETLSGGVWTPAAIPDVSSEKGFVSLSAVSCPARGSCVAVGFINPASGGSTPVIETLSGGHWAPAKPPLPDDADPTGSVALNNVSCPAIGRCVATGWYSTQGGVRDGYVDTLRQRNLDVGQRAAAGRRGT